MNFRRPKASRLQAMMYAAVHLKLGPCLCIAPSCAQIGRSLVRLLVNYSLAQRHACNDWNG